MTVTIEGTTGTKPQQKCYVTHPPLPVGNGKVIYGGSCSFPVVKDGDIYIGFDRNMQMAHRQPWFGKISALFEVTDMGIPEDKEAYRKMVVWVSEQLDAGKKVHCGCVGGHGRTGMFFAALVAYRKVSPTPITYVRENYCKKVVESKAQVDYLMKEWGCEKVEGYKTSWAETDYGDFKGGKSSSFSGKDPWGGASKSQNWTGSGKSTQHTPNLFDYGKAKPPKKEDPTDTVCYVAGGARIVGNIWSTSVKTDA